MLRKLLLATATAETALVLLLIALLIWPLPQTPQESASGDFLIRSVAVVDVDAGVLYEAQDVVIVDGRIVAVGATGTIEQPASLIVIDGTGKFLMPGLWDMHTRSTKLSSQ